MSISLESFEAAKNDLIFEAKLDFAFKPRPKNKLDKKIHLILKVLKIDDVPVIHL
jgi:hypothetical protein